jgi:hypothetical protein
MMADAEPTSLEISLVWIGVEELPIWFANQFMGQLDDQGEALITFGQVSPPALIGPPEEQVRQAKQITHVPVKPIARLALSTSRLRELVEVLQQTIENQERARGQIEQRKGAS